MCYIKIIVLGFPGGSNGKESALNVWDPGSIPGSGRSVGEGYGNLIQYSCLKFPLTEEPGGLQSMESQRIGHNWATNIHKRLKRESIHWILLNPCRYYSVFRNFLLSTLHSRIKCSWVSECYLISWFFCVYLDIL